jgi:hypothetical protein
MGSPVRLSVLEVLISEIVMEMVKGIVCLERERKEEEGIG